MMKTLNFKILLGTAFLAFAVGLLAADTDGDGLDDSVETGTGIYLSPTNTGTSPLLADTDGDGAGDWYEVATIETKPSDPQPNAPNSPTLKPNIPYPLPAPTSTPPATNKPVKVFILSGQSNMVGQGNVDPVGTPGTLATITRNEHKFTNLLNGAGWAVRNDVTYRGVIAAVGNAPLTVGQGSGVTAIGPELGFGHVMGHYHDEPVLIIKSSQGGRALGWDFLPPGSVQYTVGSTIYAGYGDSPASWATGTTPVPTVGFYGGYQYDQCFLRKADWAPAGATNPAVFNVTDVLDNFSTLYTNYAAQGFEIAGFAWFQGWNDGLSYTAAYANRYETNMAQFIRQVRSYYESRYPGKIKAKAPFVIATCAFEGWNEAYTNQYPTRGKVINAQLAVSNPSKYPEFAGNVKTMEARGFWRDVSVSPSSQGYHYNRNAETFMLVGDALGRGMVDLLSSAIPDTNAPVISSFSPADNATNVAVSANLVATFNESIVLGSGNLTLKNLTDATQTVIAITDATQVSAAGSVLTINPTANLTEASSYAVRIDATAIKDLATNSFPGITNDTTWNFTTAPPDNSAPTPNPMTWATPPAAISSAAITMTASTASDPSGVEYFFDCTSAGGHDSGWQNSPTYTDTGLAPSTSYSYHVKARDKSSNTNETAWSSVQSATTSPPDTTPPTPNPMTWATLPAALSSASITMTATTASDPSGVEYYFDCTSAGGHDSGWQSGPTYTDIGLAPATSYAYQVKARDKSANTNETSASAAATAKTQNAPSGSGAAVIYEPFADSEPTLTGNTPGTGLTNTWSATTTFSVTSGSLIYGTLPVSGNQVTYVSPFGNSASSVAIGPALSNAGLLTDGATLWFSIVVSTPWQGGSNPDTGFAIGTGALGSGNNLPMAAGGQGIGWTIKNDKLQATTWTNSTLSRPGAGPAVATNTTMLIVGEIIWGANGAADDTINLYLPDVALTKGAVVSTRTGVLNQTNFSTVTSSLKANTGYGFDEIRFGASYAAVIGAGAPSDYDQWAANFPGDDLSDRNADYDGDGQSNDHERIWGLNPTNALSRNPFTFNASLASGTFSYTRRSPALSGLSYNVLTSTNLVNWVLDAGAIQTPGAVVNGVETVAITVSPALLTQPRLFIRMRAQ